jgi:hypothetical protein
MALQFLWLRGNSEIDAWEMRIYGSSYPHFSFIFYAKILLQTMNNVDIMWYVRDSHIIIISLKLQMFVLWSCDSRSWQFTTLINWIQISLSVNNEETICSSPSWLIEFKYLYQSITKKQSATILSLCQSQNNQWSTNVKQLRSSGRLPIISSHVLFRRPLLSRQSE